MIKPACQEKNMPRRGSTKPPHLTFEAICRASKNFCALSKPLFFVHTTFIFRQCFCPVCVDVGRLKISSSGWNLHPNIQHLIWLRSDMDCAETTKYWENNYIRDVEYPYLKNRFASVFHNLESLTLVGDWGYALRKYKFSSRDPHTIDKRP